VTCFVLLALATLAACTVYIAVDEWRSRHCPYCRAARQALSLNHPGWRALATWHRHRAGEPNRVVVAVFYERPNMSFRPTPYLLFAVARDLSAVEEMADDPHSPYAIQGRR
jgi:hypothetical protein